MILVMEDVSEHSLRMKALWADPDWRANQLAKLSAGQRARHERDGTSQAWYRLSGSRDPRTGKIYFPRATYDLMSPEDLARFDESRYILFEDADVGRLVQELAS